MDSLKKILQTKAGKDPLLKEAHSQNKIFKMWSLAVDQRLSKNTRPSKYQHGTLEVTVSSPVWSNQLSLLKSEIMEKLNALIGEAAIKDVKFRVGETKKTRDQGPETRVESEENHKSREFPEILESLERKIKKNNQEKQSRGQVECASCEEIHNAAEGSLCKSCKTKLAAFQKKGIRQYVRKTPWVSFSDLKREQGAVTLDEFSKGKRAEIAYIKDEIFNVLRELKNEREGRARYKRLISKLKELCYGMAMLRTGKRPEELDEKTIKKNINREARKIIFGE